MLPGSDYLHHVCVCWMKEDKDYFRWMMPDKEYVKIAEKKGKTKINKKNKQTKK